MIAAIPDARRSILILRGVKLSAIMLNNTVSETTPKVAEAGYTPLPTRFIGLESLKWTNLKCWNCGLVPTDYPKFIPRNIEIKSDNSLHCDTEGVFSHWVCAVDYCYKELSEPALSDTLDAIKTMRAYITKQPPQITRRAIPKTKRQCYSGNAGLTDAEYTKILNALENLSPPAKLSSIYYE